MQTLPQSASLLLPTDFGRPRPSQSGFFGVGEQPPLYCLGSQLGGVVHSPGGLQAVPSSGLRTRPRGETPGVLGPSLVPEALIPLHCTLPRPVAVVPRVGLWSLPLLDDALLFDLLLGDLGVFHALEDVRVDLHAARPFLALPCETAEGPLPVGLCPLETKLPVLALRLDLQRFTASQFHVQGVRRRDGLHQFGRVVIPKCLTFGVNGGPHPHHVVLQPLQPVVVPFFGALLGHALHLLVICHISELYAVLALVLCASGVPPVAHLEQLVLRFGEEHVEFVALFPCFVKVHWKKEVALHCRIVRFDMTCTEE
mmetsp:Transcript_29903/g.58654  ORF Transcript_29903/g.58654 Transcript_29903/m.58654 type:complete len:312 (+) Transcript_29903:2461-3396(+)